MRRSAACLARIIVEVWRLIYTSRPKMMRAESSNFCGSFITWIVFYSNTAAVPSGYMFKSHFNPDIYQILIF